MEYNFLLFVNLLLIKPNEGQYVVFGGVFFYSSYILLKLSTAKMSNGHIAFYSASFQDVNSQMYNNVVQPINSTPVN